MLKTEHQVVLMYPWRQNSFEEKETNDDGFVLCCGFAVIMRLMEADGLRAVVSLNGESYSILA